LKGRQHLATILKNDKKLIEFIFMDNLYINNKITVPRYMNSISKSFIDMTLSSELTEKFIANWKVLETESMSDHRYMYITFEFNNNLVNNLNVFSNDVMCNILDKKQIGNCFVQHLKNIIH